jgi:hypothetical protein
MTRKRSSKKRKMHFYNQVSCHSIEIGILLEYHFEEVEKYRGKEVAEELFWRLRNFCDHVFQDIEDCRVAREMLKGKGNP